MAVQAKKQKAAERARLIAQLTNDGKVGQKDINAMKAAGMNAKQISSATAGVKVKAGVAPKYQQAAPQAAAPQAAAPKADVQTARARAQEATKKKASVPTAKLLNRTTKDDGKFGGKDVKQLTKKGFSKKQIRSTAQAAYADPDIRVGRKVIDKYGLAAKAKKAGAPQAAAQSQEPNIYAEAAVAPGDAPSYGEHNSGTFGATGSDGFIKTHWGNSPEVLLDYANDLGRYNRSNLEWLERAGQESQRGQEAALMRAVKKAPKFKKSDDSFEQTFAGLQGFADMFGSIGR